MVLIFILLQSFNFFSDDQSIDLLSKYERAVQKELKAYQNADLGKLSKVDYRLGELYSFQSEDKKKLFVLIQEVAACKLGGCSTFTEANDGLASEYFDVMVILNDELEIKKIKILDYFSDYGYEINSKRYLKKFVGKKACLFQKDQDNIDAISGATISSYALEGILGQLCFLDTMVK